MPPIDFIGALVSDELARRSTRLIERRSKQAQFRDPQRSLDNFDFDFNKKILTSNRPVEDWGQLLGDNAAVTAMLDRLLHHGHVIKCRPRSWRTKTGTKPKVWPPKSPHDRNPPTCPGPATGRI